MNKYNITAVIAAAGASSRMKGINKQLYMLCGKPVVAHTVEAFEKASCITEIIIVTKKENIEEYKEICSRYGYKKVTAVTAGGRERTDSVRCGINEAHNPDYIAVHDGARACITPEEIELLCLQGIKYGAAVPGCLVTDTVKRISDGKICENVDRENLVTVQTPQVFRADILKKAYMQNDNISATDDSSLVVRCGYDVHVVTIGEDNIKITRREDLKRAEHIIKNRRE